MNFLMIALCIALIFIIAVQIGRFSEISARIRGEEDTQYESNRFHGRMGVVFMVLFLVGCVISAYYYKNWMLGYGPHESASAHGGQLDSLFNWTLFFTGIVFVICHIILFWFGYKYHGRKGAKALFFPHDNKLELIWTAVPAVVMSFLVISGLVAWNDVMADVDEGEEHIEIEGMGMQFAWVIRYPGTDGALGRTNYELITAKNVLGQDWSDPKNLDDIVSSAPGEIIKLPKGKKVRVRITARDVLHNFDLPHFRVKMDAIPGLPTYFIFTPSKTTEEYREELRKYPEFHAPFDEEDPESPPLWEAFNFELACAELCGKGHYSMRRIVEIVEYDEWVRWMREQNPFYLTSIRGSDEDPFKDQLLDVEIQQRKADFLSTVESALLAANEEERVINLEHVTFKTGSAELTENSKYELDNLVSVLRKYPDMRIEISGHTDNTGEAEANLQLSQARANAVAMYLSNTGNIGSDRYTAVGYGAQRPVGDNNTEEGKAQNRRTEFKILTQ